MPTTKSNSTAAVPLPDPAQLTAALRRGNGLRTLLGETDTEKGARLAHQAAAAFRDAGDETTADRILAALSRSHGRPGRRPKWTADRDQELVRAVIDEMTLQVRHGRRANIHSACEVLSGDAEWAGYSSNALRLHWNDLAARYDWSRERIGRLVQALAGRLPVGGN